MLDIFVQILHSSVKLLHCSQTLKRCVCDCQLVAITFHMQTGRCQVRQWHGKAPSAHQHYITSREMIWHHYTNGNFSIYFSPFGPQGISRQRRLPVGGLLLLATLVCTQYKILGLNVPLQRYISTFVVQWIYILLFFDICGLVLQHSACGPSYKSASNKLSVNVFTFNICTLTCQSEGL